jgi:hypothetical protein
MRAHKLGALKPTVPPIARRALGPVWQTLRFSLPPSDFISSLRAHFFGRCGSRKPAHASSRTGFQFGVTVSRVDPEGVRVVGKGGSRCRSRRRSRSPSTSWRPSPSGAWPASPPPPLATGRRFPQAHTRRPVRARRGAGNRCLVTGHSVGDAVCDPPRNAPLRGDAVAALAAVVPRRAVFRLHAPAAAARRAGCRGGTRPWPVPAWWQGRVRLGWRTDPGPGPARLNGRSPAGPKGTAEAVASDSDSEGTGKPG